MPLDYGYVHNGLAKIVLDFCRTHGIPLIMRGLPKPSLEGQDDWLRFNLLEGRPVPDPQAYVYWNIEVAITSKKAHCRTDGRFDAPYRIFRELKPLIHRANVTIEGICIRSKEVLMTHLDNRTIGQGFDNMSVTSPDSNTHTLLTQTTFVETSGED